MADAADPKPGALERARARHGVAPRELDEELAQLARGDRGCLWLAVSGLGVVGTGVVAVASMKGWIGFSWAYLGLAVWIGGTVMGARAQSASEKHRRAALESAPLVAGRVVVSDPHLMTSGKQAGRALVVFRSDAGGEGGLRALAERVRRAENTELATMRADRFAAGPRRLASFDLEAEISDAEDVWLAWIVVDPLRIAGGRLEDHHAELPLLANIDAGVIEHLG